MKSAGSRSIYGKMNFPAPFLAILLAFHAQGGAGSQGPERVFEDFDAKDFTHPTNIDNEWLPLKPGRQWVLEGTTTEKGETLSHRIEFTVTDLNKEIAGVKTVVALVEDYVEDEVIETEIAHKSP